MAIWPFAGYGRSINRNPSSKWWGELVKKLTDNSINVYHFGYFKEPFLSENKKIKCVEVSSRGNVFWELNNPEDVQRIEKVIS